MSKPRIIIADTDFGYIIPLQLKFIESFFEQIEFEIITDKNFFFEEFSVSQSADILIVSEELYDKSIQRHNITNIFVMTEQNEEEQTVDLNVDLIFKYTSIKEIFNEITGKCAGIFDLHLDRKNVTQIILVYSASGGVGKTTIAMGISACLTKNHKKVLYINAEHLQTFQRLLDNKTSISAADVYAKLANEDDDIYDNIKHVIRKEQFSYLPPFKAALMSVGLNYSLYEKFALSAKKSTDFDYIVIDADSVFDEDKARLFGIADKVIVVTNQTFASVYATNALISNITGANSDKYIYVCNNFNKEEDNALISPTTALKFTVSDYVEHINHYDRMRCVDLLKENGIQKIAFLVI